MEVFVAVSIILYAAVLFKACQLLFSGRANCVFDRNVSAAFAANSLFFFAISVANGLYLDELVGRELHGLLALWSGAMIFNGTIQLAVMVTVCRRITGVGKSRRGLYELGR